MGQKRLLGFAVWYYYNGAPRRYYPDFVVELTDGSHVVVETKGKHDEESQARRTGLELWTKAVQEAQRFGVWHTPILSLNIKDLKTKIDNLSVMAVV